MTFIETVSASEAEGEVETMYARQQQAFGYLPNYAKIFSPRPDVMNAWADLLGTIKGDVRRFELVTFAAACEMGNSYCALAHGHVLCRDYLDKACVREIAEGSGFGAVSDAEAAIMAFARKIAADPKKVTQQDVDALRDHGLNDAEVFEIVAIVAGRAFFTTMLDGLGAAPDSAYREMDADLVASLSVGRSISDEPLEYLKGAG